VEPPVGHRIQALLRRFNLPLPGGIALRISLLSWLVTLLTLAVYVTAMIPQQKSDLLNALDSKARGISSSLLDVTAGAAVSEDYTSVVDQCLQVLSGDQAIDYLVITKNDGFSVIVARDGWRTSALGSFWRPEVRQISSGIRVVPLLDRRVFHFSRPFDYSSIHWGWIHVGLSLSSYDRSVAAVYQRTLVLTVLCGCFSLAASLWYARHLVKPIQELQAAVQRVAGGDLAARAPSNGPEEIGGLAVSFNSMADSILQRNRILESIRYAAQQFLVEPDWRAVVPELLSRLGTAVRATRGAVFRNQESPAGESRTVMVYSWEAPGFASPEDQGYLLHLRTEGVALGSIEPRLRSGEIVQLDYREREALDGEPVPGQPPASILMPIHVETDWFGFLAFEDCQAARQWSEAELDALRTAAGMLGATITRDRAQEALIEAKQMLEGRVAERTSELQDQVNAKEQARAELAEAQQRLMELSRAAGKAEVATGVLHNVGNVLNSVNVSSNLIESTTHELRIDQMAAAVAMLQKHTGDIAEFVGGDPSGQRILPYLEKLGRHFQQERTRLLEEVRLLQDHVGHIKQIVATQQNYAKVCGLAEGISLVELIDDSFRIVQPGYQRARIRLEHSCEKLPPIWADKHQLLQILLNLLQNAKQAVSEADPPERLVQVRIRRHTEDRVRIEVRDTGIGLPHENLTRIFAHGFTTKKDGHGFGLHSGALAARQMGGALWAESDGPGRGATFVLELPIAAKGARRKDVA
jgi:two-component system NtrC family sensor kinase